MGLMHFLNLVFYSAFAELKAENNRTMAGYMWWVIEPLMSLGVYFFVFSFLRSGEGNFLVFLFTGIVMWRWFQSCVMRSSSSLVKSRALMMQVNLNKMVLPLSIVIVGSIKFLITLVLLLVLVLVSGESITSAWLGLPILLFSQFIFIVACSFAVASVTPFFPDFEHILTTLIMLMMFASGIFYSLDLVPEPVRSVLNLNPMANLISQYRNIFLDGISVNIQELLIVWAEAGVILAIGMFLLIRFSKLYPKIV